MNKLATLLIILSLYGCSNYPPGLLNDEPSLKVDLVLHDSIPEIEKKAIREKIQVTSRRLFDDFNLSVKEVFHVHIWLNYFDFLDAQEQNIGQRVNGSGGYVFSKNDLALYYNETMLENVEHEFSHAASLHLNSDFGNNPRWFWESVAIYEAGEFTHPNEIEYLVMGNFPSLSELNGMLTKDGANKIYKMGYLLSEFIIHKWGREKYLELILESGDLEKVLAISTPVFEQQWEKFVLEKYLTLK